MSGGRLVATTAVMAAVAAGLRALTPDLPALPASGLDLQHVVDTSGPETLLLTGVAALAWLVWAWGALGLALTALSALPGLAGAAARVLLRGLLPASGRRAAALALGIGLVAAPALTACTTTAGAPVVVPAADTRAPAVPDWPLRAPPLAVPDWPAPPGPAAVPDRPGPATAEHVVLRGECLWSIAEADLRARTGRHPTGAQTLAAVDRWHTANAAVIGDDPDLLLPGQVLRPPA
ncbi:LysM peptidoglycan-binding domain-containing protein [Geodermatophilus sp. SYSU D00814]